MLEGYAHQQRTEERALAHFRQADDEAGDAAVSTPAATLDDLLAAVLRIERKVDALSHRRGGPPAELLSMRAAAKLLGVDRGVTLPALLKTQRVRTVMVAGRPRVPRAALERVLLEGAPTSTPAPRARHTRPALASEPSALRALKLDDL
jgi:hypothetical protein